MKKQLIVTTIAAGSLLGSVTTVGAQEQVTNVTKSTTDAPITTEVKSTETTTVTKPVTNEKGTDAKTEAPKPVSQQDVDTAKYESDQAKQNVTKQQEVISEKQNQLQDVEKTVTEIKEQVKEVNSVTSEKVADTKSDADAKAKSVTSAVESVQSAEKSVSATSEKVANQTKVVSNAEKTATATAEKVADAQKKVDSLSSTTDITKLEGDVYGLTNQVTVDTKAVTTAQGKLDEGKKAIADKEQAMKNAQKKVDSLEATLKEKATILNNANSTLAQKEEALNSSKANLNSAKEELEDASIINNTSILSKEYVSLLKEYLSKGKPEALGQKLKELGFKEFQKVGNVTFDNGEVYRFDLPFKSTKKDQNTKISVNNLDYETRKEITLFAADLINQIRKQYGSAPVTVTEDSLRISEEATKAATVGFGHDYTALENVGNANKVLLSELVAFKDEPITTLAELKHEVYDSIISMLYDDSHVKFGHVKQLVGYHEPNEGYMQYVGLATRSSSKFPVAVHFVGISDNVIFKDAKFDKTKVISAPSTSEKVARLQENVNLAETGYLNAHKELEDAKNAVYLAKTSYGKVDYELFSARNLLSDIRMNKVDITALEEALANAKSKLAEDTQALQTAKEVLAIAKSNAIDKAKALVEAKKSLAIAKAEQKTADETLATAKGELEVLTKAHDVAVLALTKAKGELTIARTESVKATNEYNLLNSALINQDKVLKSLNAKLEEFNAKIATIRAELETAKEELTRLEVISKAKEDDYLKVKSLKDAQDKAETEAKRLKELQESEAKRLQALKEKEAQIKANGGVVTPVFDASGKVVDYTDGHVQDTKQLTVTTATKFTQSEGSKTSNAQLPETGTKDTTWVSALGIALASVGFVGFSPKRKEEN